MQRTGKRIALFSVLLLVATVVFGLVVPAPGAQTGIGLILGAVGVVIGPGLWVLGTVLARGDGRNAAVSTVLPAVTEAAGADASGVNPVRVVEFRSLSDYDRWLATWGNRIDIVSTGISGRRYTLTYKGRNPLREQSGQDVPASSQLAADNSRGWTQASTEGESAKQLHETEASPARADPGLPASSTPVESVRGRKLISRGRVIGGVLLLAAALLVADPTLLVALIIAILVLLTAYVAMRAFRGSGRGVTHPKRTIMAIALVVVVALVAGSVLLDHQARADAQQVALDELTFATTLHDQAASIAGMQRLFAAIHDSSANSRAAEIADILSTTTAEAAAVFVENDRLLDGAFIDFSKATKVVTDDVVARSSGDTKTLSMLRNPSSLDLLANKFGSGTAAADGGDASVFFVNGVLNTEVDAIESVKALAPVLGGTPSLVYNHSIVETAIQKYNCLRALVMYLHEHGKPNADAGDVDALAETARQAAPSSHTAAEEAATSVGGSLTLGAVQLACALAILDANPASRLTSELPGELVINNLELLSQRFLTPGSALASLGATDKTLVERIETAIMNGHRVVLIGHSQGTLFLRSALAQVNAWYPTYIASRYLEGRCGASDAGPPPDAGPAPVGALYIAPAFGDIGPATNKDLQRYVMLPGDILHTLGVAGGSGLTFASPLPAQDSWDKIANHALATYLLEGSQTRAEIARMFRELDDKVKTMPNADELCANRASTVLPLASVTGVETGPCTTPAPGELPGWINCPGTVTLQINRPVPSGEVGVQFDWPSLGSFFHGTVHVGTRTGPIPVPVVNTYVSRCVGTYVSTVTAWDGVRDGPVIAQQQLKISNTCP